MQCSVIIPCFGGADLTRSCIASLLKQRGEHELEIVLVDNKNEPETNALAAMHPCVRVLPQAQNLGFAGGTNQGIRAAQHPYLLMLNNDTQAAPHLLSRLHAALSSDPRIAFAAPVSNFVRGEAKIHVGSRGATAAGRDEIETDLAAESGMLQDLDNLSGLCLLTHRTTLAQIGLFDERFGIGNFEDDDLSLRARIAGFRLVIARDAFLHHEGHQTFKRMGIDLNAELALRYSQFVDKWLADPAGGACLHAKQNLTAAAVLAEHARQVHPKWIDADWILGRFFVVTKQHAIAAQHLTNFLAHCPVHTEAMILLGMCWLELQQFSQAQKLWTVALGTCHFEQKQAADLLRRLGEHARSRGLLDCAIANFEDAVEQDPLDANLSNWLGIALLEARDFKRAIKALERAAAGGFALAHTNLGICHFQLGDNQKSLHHFAAASALLPTDPTAQANLLQAQSAFGSAAANLG
jgi:GT2 family glycosyltransferase/Tfp pilus assembly protein PilF